MKNPSFMKWTGVPTQKLTDVQSKWAAERRILMTAVGLSPQQLCDARLCHT